ELGLREELARGSGFLRRGGGGEQQRDHPGQQGQPGKAAWLHGQALLARNGEIPGSGERGNCNAAARRYNKRNPPFLLVGASEAWEKPPPLTAPPDRPSSTPSAPPPAPCRRRWRGSARGRRRPGPAPGRTRSVSGRPRTPAPAGRR